MMISWVIVDFLGHTAHQFMHYLNVKAHDEHHQLYTSASFLSTKYREASSRSGRIQDFFYTLLAVPYLYIVYYFGGVVLMFHALGVTLLFAFLNHYIHKAIHKEAHWLERFKLFRKMRENHKVHHVENFNFGILSMLFDKIKGTYKEYESRRIQ